MNVAINNSIYRQASDYAQSRGLNFTEVIENFLVRFIGKDKDEEAEQPVPDIVLSLLGAGEPVADDDLNARKEAGDRLMVFLKKYRIDVHENMIEEWSKLQQMTEEADGDVLVRQDIDLFHETIIRSLSAGVSD